MDTTRLKELVAELDGMRRRLMELRGKNPGDRARYILHPPAGDAEIDAEERRTGFPYPPSYRAFLKLHNGWLGFWPDWSLVGVARKDTSAMHKDVKNTCSLLSTVATREQRDKLPEEEKTDPRTILITNHAVLATDFNGSVLLFDRNRVKAGEPEVAWVHYVMHVERRWPDFEALLNDAIADTRANVEKEGGSSAPAGAGAAGAGAGAGLAAKPAGRKSGAKGSRASRPRRAGRTAPAGKRANTTSAKQAPTKKGPTKKAPAKKPKAKPAGGRAATGRRKGAGR